MKNNEGKILISMVLALTFITIGIVSTMVLAQVYPTGMVSYWKFDEGTGTTAFDAVDNNHGTIYGATWTSGKVDRALNFDGGDDYIDAGVGYPNTYRLRTFSIEAWIYWRGGTYFHTIIAKPAGREYINNKYHYGFGLTVYNGKLMVWSNEDFYFPWAQSSINVPTNTWIHVAVTCKYIKYKAREFHLYLNGEEIAIGDAMVGGTALATPTIYIGSGSASGMGPYWFNGVIDELAIYDRVITSELILQHYQNGLNGTGYYENQPPIANAGPDQTVECTSCCATEVTLNGTGSSDPDGDPLTYHWTWDGGSASGPKPTISLPLGTTTIQLVVNDGKVDSDPDYVDIIVVDTTPPEISVSVSPNELWPPNHKMVDIVATVTVSDICDPEPDWELFSIESNEPEEGPGKKHYPDIMRHEPGTQDVEFQLRAERLGRGEGRIYTITYRAKDESGNSATAEATVTVPHDRGRMHKALAYNAEIPMSYTLFQNNPNPFNPETEIRFSLVENGEVQLTIYDILGRVVQTLVEGELAAGTYTVRWDGRDTRGQRVASGIYLYHLATPKFSATKKMTILR